MIKFSSVVALHWPFHGVFLRYQFSALFPSEYVFPVFKAHKSRESQYQRCSRERVLSCNTPLVATKEGALKKDRIIANITSTTLSMSVKYIIG